jgi:hypothetical protein
MIQKKTSDELWEEALRRTKRQPDGSILKKDLSASLAGLIEINIDEVKKRIAKNIVDEMNPRQRLLPFGPQPQ